jgi:Zn-dependent M28 family amino/carboxypeptidase
MQFRAIALAILLTASALAQKLDKLPNEALQTINPNELKMNLEFLASPELGGRYTLSPSFPIAAKYLATRLASYGYKGAANGDFYQKFDVISSQAEPDKSSLSLAVKGEKSEHPYGDFFNSGYVGGDVSGQIVFVGTGISSKSVNHDDYANLDVKGKIVLIAGGTPKGIDADKIGDKNRGADAAAKHGAVAAFMLPARYMLAQMRSGTMRNASRERAMLAADKDKKIPEIRLGPEVADQLLTLAGTSLKAVLQAEENHAALTPKALDASAELHISVKQQTWTTQNVVGVLQGSDPKLKDEYVAFSAHYDHLKTGADGRIYPGADDDGSGTVSVLNIAKALSVSRPKRSVLIIFHAGEELGLLGSKYNADYSPIVPLDKIVTDLNIDMIGRERDANPKNAEIADKNTIYPIGADKISKELSDIHERTNQDYEKLKFDYKLNDPNEPNRFYFRSDHWNYAKHGIPIIFWFDGTGEDYHQPTDTVDKIDFEKMARVARLAYGTGYRVANLDHKLKRDFVYVNAD